MFDGRWTQVVDRPARPCPAASARTTYRGLTMAGLTAGVAGNITAWLLGLATARGGWTIGEIGHLEFLRHLVERGVIDP